VGRWRFFPGIDRPFAPLAEQSSNLLDFCAECVDLVLLSRYDGIELLHGVFLVNGFGLEDLESLFDFVG
jgi:hypothetical protein